ncbi:MAG: ATP-binding cassette domain-containing protein [Blautia hansenii]
MAKQFRVEEGFFYSDQKMGSLSGGEKMKAALMRIFMEEPTVLLLDEPSNDMDIDTLKLLEEIILSWKGIVLYISHDETLIENTANMIIHIEQIARKTKCRYTVMRVPYREYVEQRLKGFEKQKKEAINERSEKKKRDEKYRRVVQSVEHAQNVITRQNPAGGRLLKKKMHAVKSMERRFQREDENMTEMPEIEEAIYFKLGDENLGIPAGKTVIEYSLDKLWTPDGSRILAQNIFLRIRGEEKICIIGSNGSGKTTLLKKISEELLQRKDIHAEYMPQNYEELLSAFRMTENILMSYVIRYTG